MPPRATLRLATLDDLDTLVRQRRRMFEDMGIDDLEALDAQDRAYRRWARARLSSGTLVGFLVETRADGVIAGGCVWLQEAQPKPWVEGVTQPYLLSVYTEPHARGRGHAKRITRAAVAWARERGYTRLALHASDAGRPIYEKLGFERTWEMRLDFPARRSRA